MGKKLFVGGLPWAADDRDLTAAFSAIGTVIEARVITDRETGKSRGFGFVTMETDEQAAECVTKMDGADIKGRPVRVREAEERSGGGRGGGGGYGGGGGFQQQQPEEDGWGKEAQRQRKEPKKPARGSTNSRWEDGGGGRPSTQSRQKGGGNRRQWDVEDDD